MQQGLSGAIFQREGRQVSQSQTIYTHLRRHRTITPQQAWARYSIARLADVVHKLRRAGHSVITEPQRAGRACYARYRLV